MRGALVIVKQMDKDSSIGRQYVPNRRLILEARIDELERMRGRGRQVVRRISARHQRGPYYRSEENTQHFHEAEVIVMECLFHGKAWPCGF
jgi:hypothetical protein